MIKLITLLLFATVCFALLDQSKGEREPTLAEPSERKSCPSYWFKCMVHNPPGEAEAAVVCVPFKNSLTGCTEKMTKRQIGDLCMKKIESLGSPLIFARAKKTSDKCLN